jgi:hypothetical protein
LLSSIVAAAGTTTGSLQQQASAQEIIGNPIIPIEPEEEEPEDNIPENETGDDDRDCYKTDLNIYCDISLIPDTWINWVRTLDTGKDVRDGGHTTSHHFKVSFQGTVEGHGSHIDLRIDNRPYVPVTSPHTITGLSEGATHTISVRAVEWPFCAWELLLMYCQRHSIERRM